MPKPYVSARMAAEPYPGFKDDLDRLAAANPLSAPLVVHAFHLGNRYGTTYRERGRFLIELETGHDRAVMRDTLIHEYAHAMVWESTQGGPEAHHGPLWGVAYAACYCALMFPKKSKRRPKKGRRGA